MYKRTKRTMSTTAFSIFNDLRLEGLLCDVVFRVEAVELNAHKVIMCGCSSYFHVLFTSGWHPTEKRLYCMLDVSPDVMELIIQYAYTSSVAVTSGNVEALLRAADQYCVMGVVQVCRDFLEGQLCLENCINIWKLCDIYNLPDLRDKAFALILRHFEEIVHLSKDFLDLTLQELSNIMEHDQLNVKQEGVVFEAALHWISHSPDERKAHIAVLLPKVRLALMTSDYLMSKVWSHALVKDNPDCRPVINKVWRAMYDHNMNEPSHNYNPLASPRYEILLDLGGWGNYGPINGSEAYDPRADCWVDMTYPLQGGYDRGVVFLNGFIYCICGWANQVRKLNPVTRTWHRLTPMHSPRAYLSVAALNGCIYAMGGREGEHQDTAERYDPETNQWTVITPMHEARTDANATALHGKAYICGGHNVTGNLNTAECYDPETNQWTMMEPMTTSRSGVGVIAYGEHIYAVGGFDGENFLHSVEAYNPQTNTWQDISNMSHARCSFGIEVVDDRLVVLGGSNVCTAVDSVEYYDARSREWSQGPAMKDARSNLGCCVIQGLPNMEQYTVPRKSRKRKMDLLEDRPNKVFRPDLPEAGSSTAQVHG